MNVFLKELFEKEPSLLKEPIDCSEITKRIVDFIRDKNKQYQQYLDALKVTFDDKGNVLIDVKEWYLSDDRMFEIANIIDNEYRDCNKDDFRCIRIKEGYYRLSLEQCDYSSVIRIWCKNLIIIDKIEILPVGSDCRLVLLSTMQDIMDKFPGHFKESN